MEEDFDWISNRVWNRIDGCLCRAVMELGYRRENMVATPANLRFVEDIVDIYPLDQEYPLRLDFFDTEVDSIGAFNAET